MKPKVRYERFLCCGALLTVNLGHDGQVYSYGPSPHKDGCDAPGATNSKALA